MQIQINLTDRQYMRLKRIQKEYKDRGLKYTMTETLGIVLRTQMKGYVDDRLDYVEGMLFTTIRGRIKGEKL